MAELEVEQRVRFDHVELEANDRPESVDHGETHCMHRYQLEFSVCPEANVIEICNTRWVFAGLDVLSYEKLTFPVQTLGSPPVSVSLSYCSPTELTSEQFKACRGFHLFYMLELPMSYVSTTNCDRKLTEELIVIPRMHREYDDSFPEHSSGPCERSPFELEPEVLNALIPWMSDSSSSARSSEQSMQALMERYIEQCPYTAEELCNTEATLRGKLVALRGQRDDGCPISPIEEMFFWSECFDMMMTNLDERVVALSELNEKVRDRVVYDQQEKRMYTIDAASFTCGASGSIGILGTECSAQTIGPHLQSEVVSVPRQKPSKYYFDKSLQQYHEEDRKKTIDVIRDGMRTMGVEVLDPDFNFQMAHHESSEAERAEVRHQRLLSMRTSSLSFLEPPQVSASSAVSRSTKRPSLKWLLPKKGAILLDNACLRVVAIPSSWCWFASTALFSARRFFNVIVHTRELNRLLNSMGIEPNDIALYREAFTTESYANKNEDSRTSYKRLASLGRCAMKFFLTDTLVRLYGLHNWGRYDEGFISQKVMELINNQEVSDLYTFLNKQFGLDSCLLSGLSIQKFQPTPVPDKQQANSKSRSDAEAAQTRVDAEVTKIRSDAEAIRALIGAIVVDQGLCAARKFYYKVRFDKERVGPSIKKLHFDHQQADELIAYLRKKWMCPPRFFSEADGQSLKRGTSLDVLTGLSDEEAEKYGPLFEEGNETLANATMSLPYSSLLHCEFTRPEGDLQVDYNNLFRSQYQPYQKRQQLLLQLEDRVGHRFQYRDLLITALNIPMHEGNTKEAKKNRSGKGYTFELLELVGDAILEFIIAAYVYREFPNHPGALLSNATQDLLTNDPSLLSIADDLELEYYSSNLHLRAGAMMVLDATEEHKNALQKRLFTSQFRKSRADIVEALVGSLYVDAGISTDQHLSFSVAGSFLQQTLESSLVAYYIKDGLNEHRVLVGFLQRLDLPPDVVYTRQMMTGENMRRDDGCVVGPFYAGASVAGETIGEGAGETIVAAQHDAARNAVARLIDRPDLVSMIRRKQLALLMKRKPASAKSATAAASQPSTSSIRSSSPSSVKTTDSAKSKKKGHQKQKKKTSSQPDGVDSTNASTAPNTESPKDTRQRRSTTPGRQRERDSTDSPGGSKQSRSNTPGRQRDRNRGAKGKAPAAPEPEVDTSALHPGWRRGQEQRQSAPQNTNTRTGKKTAAKGRDDGSAQRKQEQRAAVQRPQEQRVQERYDAPVASRPVRRAAPSHTLDYGYESQVEHVYAGRKVDGQAYSPQVPYGDGYDRSGYESERPPPLGYYVPYATRTVAPQPPAQQQPQHRQAYPRPVNELGWGDREDAVYRYPTASPSPYRPPSRPIRPEYSDPYDPHYAYDSDYAAAPMGTRRPVQPVMEPVHRRPEQEYRHTEQVRRPMESAHRAVEHVHQPTEQIRQPVEYVYRPLPASHPPAEQVHRQPARQSFQGHKEKKGRNNKRRG